MSKENKTYLVSITMDGKVDDPYLTLTWLLAHLKQTQDSVLEVEILEDDMDFINSLDDDEYDFFDNLMGEV